ncbi:hypothetical protein F2Q70_00004099 [Brassica cretica]|uniref:Uncharacterized protein n=1 Tax=Brassica cretica TaxID=69181 RepID=A0A8S9IUW6_BRACR|nr:hypothetical protein F2Q70_00004099 [Brassica cretica]
MGLLRWRESRADNVLRFERRFVRMCCIFLIAYTTIYSGSYKVESNGRIDYKDTLHNDMVKLIKTKVEWVFHVAECKPPMDSSLELVWSRLWIINNNDIFMEET